jgi:vitamin B12 transporter
MPGVTISNYGSTGANYSANSLMINGSPKVVVLIDGMRVNTNGNTSSVFSANELADMNMVERVEVLRGAASTLYGADAEGGVINIITRRVDEDQISTSLGYSMGSYHREQYNFRHAGSKNGFYWAITGQKRNVSDYRIGHHGMRIPDGINKKIPEDVRDKTWGLKLGRKFADGVSSLELDYSRYLSDYMRPEDPNKGTFTPLPGKKDNSRIAINYIQKLGDNLTNRLSVFRNRNDLDDAYIAPNCGAPNWGSCRWLMNLRSTGFSDQITFQTDAHVLIGGIDYFKDEMLKYDDSYGAIDKQSMTSKALFIQDAWNFTPGWTLTPGVRFDHNSVFGNHTSLALTLNYIHNGRTNYYVSYKESYVAPNFYHLYSPTYGNTNLNPEEGRTVEAGVKHQFDTTMNGTLSVYKRKTKDAIAWADGGYFNVNKEKAWGTTATLSKSFLRHFLATVGYTYLHIGAQEGQNANRDGHWPRHTWNLGLGYAISRFSTDLNVRGVTGREFRKSDTYPHKDSSYWIADLSANYQPFRNTRIFARVNNLFNEYYSERAYYADPAQWYPQPGRNFQAGLEFVF